MPAHKFIIRRHTNYLQIGHLHFQHGLGYSLNGDRTHFLFLGQKVENDHLLHEELARSSHRLFKRVFREKHAH